MVDLPSTLLGVAMAFQQGMEARQQGRMADAVERFSEVITAGVDAPDFRNVARIERVLVTPRRGTPRAAQVQGIDDECKLVVRFDGESRPAALNSGEVSVRLL